MLLRQREQCLAIKKVGSIKNSVLTAQMANVITRKRLYGKDTNEDTKIRRMKSCVGEKLQAEKLHNILKHLKGKALELPVSILSKFIEQKGLEFSLILVKNLPALQEGLKNAQAQTATLI